MKSASKYIAALVLLAMAVLPALPAHAGSVDNHYSQITYFNAELNERQYTELNEVLGRKITDETNRVIGKVTDVRLGKGGVIKTFIADFDNIGAGSGRYAVNPRLLQKPSRGSYSMSMHRDNAGRFVSEIEPATGSEASFPANSLVGAKITGASGQRFGTVQKVLLNSSGSRVFALLVRGGYGKVGTYALPINNGVSSDDDKIFLDAAYSSALERFLGE
jgi:sporulation protein YlmC with PRC-barrel domain